MGRHGLQEGVDVATSEREGEGGRDGVRVNLWYNNTITERRNLMMDTTALRLLARSRLAERGTRLWVERNHDQPLHSRGSR